ncbi:gliding motility-associated C-terminal domain-containing protein [Persicitalea jodogahamensis]|nr:gliding motility-associated C-terminal domain-containing protein [Persicitalea jodogahamensis]
MKSIPATISPILLAFILQLWAVRAMGQCAALATGEYKTGAVSTTLSGCLPLSVEVHNDLPGATNTRHLFDYRGGAVNPDSLTRDSIRVYQKPGFYTLVQFSEKDGQKYLACTNVQVTDTLAPAVRAIACANGGVQLVFDPKQPTLYPTYQVDWGDTEIKGYPGLGRKITYQYAAPKSYDIRVRGVHTPGQCRGAVTRLTFVVPENLNPPSIIEARMTSETKLDLQVRNSLATELILQKGSANGVFDLTGQKLGESQNTVESTLELPDKICFRLQPADSCLAELRSRPICASDFAVDGTAEENTISWKIDHRPPGIRAVIQKDGVDWEDVTSSGTSGSATDREFVCGREVCYQLVVNYGDFTFYSLEKCLTVPLDDCTVRPPFYLPDAFSPNGDGVNDILKIEGVLSPEFAITIYNKWGMALFHSEDPATSWDGKFNSQLLPAGTYAYSIRYLDRSGKYLVKRGAVYLLR